MVFTNERLEKLLSVVSKRQSGLTVILENVHDPHNIGAILRSCDSAGIFEIFIVYNHPNKAEVIDLISKNTSTGSTKWIKIHIFDDIQTCYNVVHQKYDKIYTTHLGQKATSLYDINLTQKVALVFGNEHEGLSGQAISASDGNFLIPMYGMVQSLNISVACAVSLFEAARQRREAGMFDLKFDTKNVGMVSTLKHYITVDRKRVFDNDPEAISNITNDILDFLNDK